MSKDDYNTPEEIVASVLCNLGPDFDIDELRNPAEKIAEIATTLWYTLDIEDDPDTEINDIHLKSMKTIIEYANYYQRRILINIINLDETLIMFDKDEKKFKLKCEQAWLERMAREQEEDAKNGTLTLWGTCTTRYMGGGIYKLLPCGEVILRDEIKLVTDYFKAYINSHLNFVTGGYGPHGSPGNKVKYSLDRLHELGIPRQDIVIFDHDLETIQQAMKAGYHAIFVTPSAVQAALTIRNTNIQTCAPASNIAATITLQHLHQPAHSQYFPIFFVLPQLTPALPPKETASNSKFDKKPKSAALTKYFGTSRPSIPNRPAPLADVSNFIPAHFTK